MRVLVDRDGGDRALSSGASGRRARRVCAAWASAGLLLALWTISAPDSAHAWAWKDTCVFRLWNRTGSTGSVHPIVYIGIPPSEPSELLYTQLAIIGVPVNTPITLSNTGYPLTFGCNADLALANPGSNVACHAFAPSSGRNLLVCGGNASVHIYQDNDDIKGDVFVPNNTPSPNPAFDHPFANPVPSRVVRLTSAAPKRGILRRRDLKGTGWYQARKVSDFGELGQLVTADSLPASCQDHHKQREARARRGGASAFARRHGTQVAGAVYGVYSNIANSRRTLGAAVSRHSIRCLARLLTSKRLRSRVSTRRQSATAWRLVIRRRDTRPAYLDVVGLRHRRANALALFIRSGAPTTPATERSAVAAVARRLR